MYGKSEAGVRPDLEGTWVLESLEGYTSKGDARQKLEDLANAKTAAASRNDTITTTTTKNGVTTTSREINLERTNDLPKITPPQGSNYHIPERPTISFFGSNETFSGFTGCNKYSGRYVQQDSTSLELKTASPSTKMVCLGDWDEAAFIAALHRVTKFKGTESTLELMEGGNTIMTFRRKSGDK
jgi:heat shock protein HslJ